jgi:hypothetical protein
MPLGELTSIFVNIGQSIRAILLPLNSFHQNIRLKPQHHSNSYPPAEKRKINRQINPPQPRKSLKRRQSKPIHTPDLATIIQTKEREVLPAIPLVPVTIPKEPKPISSPDLANIIQTKKREFLPTIPLTRVAIPEKTAPVPVEEIESDDSSDAYPFSDEDQDSDDYEYSDAEEMQIHEEIPDLSSLDPFPIPPPPFSCAISTACCCLATQ